MNDDFEKTLLALTRAVRRPDPTPGWKAEILARARREAGVPPMKALLPPRALAIAWAAAWAAIALLHILTPRDESMRPDVAGGGQVPSLNAPGALTASTATLIAFGRQSNFNGELQ